MSLTFTGTGGLLTRLGRFGKLILSANTYQAGVPADLESLLVQYDAATPPGLRDAVAALSLARESAVNTVADWLNSFAVTAAQQTLQKMVLADNPARAGTIQSCLQEVIRQMVAGTVTVKRSTVSASVSAGSVGGDGAVVASALTESGLPAELILPEVGFLQCSTATAATYTGGAKATAGVCNWDWPGGSGAAASIPVATPGSGSALTNGDLETWTVANVPDNWTVASGTAGTDVLQDASVFYDGLSSLKFTAASSNQAVVQAVSLAPLQPYLLSFWCRTSGSGASAGVLTAALIDGAVSPATVNDEQGAANSLAVTLSGLTAATWTRKTVVFRTPRVLPATGVHLRLKLTTNISGANLNLDRVILSPMTRLYSGGPWLAMHAGATPFSPGDWWTVTGANDRGGASSNATFQALFDRLFAMSAYNLVLPSASSPSVADTLITS